MNFSSRGFVLLAAVLILMPSSVEGQQPLQGITMVERVLAVVGDSVILMTELEENLLRMEAQGWARPTEVTELLDARLEILDQLINQQLIIQEAAKDTLLDISEEDLEDRVQQEIEAQVIAQRCSSRQARPTAPRQGRGTGDVESRVRRGGDFSGQYN